MKHTHRPPYAHTPSTPAHWQIRQSRRRLQPHHTKIHKQSAQTQHTWPTHKKKGHHTHTRTHNNKPTKKGKIAENKRVNVTINSYNCSDDKYDASSTRRNLTKKEIQQASWFSTNILSRLTNPSLPNRKAKPTCSTGEGKCEFVNVSVEVVRRRVNEATETELDGPEC